MAKKKVALRRKPGLPTEGVRGFTEIQQGALRAKRRSAVASQRAEVSAASRFPPSGDIRLTVNIRSDLHMLLKMEAVKRRTTVGEILEELVQQHITS